MIELHQLCMVQLYEAGRVIKKNEAFITKQQALLDRYEKSFAKKCDSPPGAEYKIENIMGGTNTFHQSSTEAKTDLKETAEPEDCQQMPDEVEMSLVPDDTP